VARRVRRGYAPAFVGDDFRAAGRSCSSVMLEMRESYEVWLALAAA
jgi:hypothetical protein